ncbi:MAG: Fe-S-containing hydro-lyase [Candidatus Caldatribacteriota bacterium]|nr:Fe-S-containing hydro-lyase [Candidatus Caldatribacteriota bacterium]
MKKAIKITTPLHEEKIIQLKTGDFVNITGNIYGARDAAHKRFFELIEKGKKLPIDLKGQIIFYAGPTPTKPGHSCGSVGPTTSYRMDTYTPELLERGLKGMIGKGLRSKEVMKSIKKNKAIYFAAIGGAAALIAKSVKKSEVVAYKDLGAEAVFRFYVEDFPAIVVVDSAGNNLYETEPPKYRK